MWDKNARPKHAQREQPRCSELPRLSAPQRSNEAQRSGTAPRTAPRSSRPSPPHSPRSDTCPGAEVRGSALPSRLPDTFLPHRARAQPAARWDGGKVRIAHWEPQKSHRRAHGNQSAALPLPSGSWAQTNLRAGAPGHAGSASPHGRPDTPPNGERGTATCANGPRRPAAAHSPRTHRSDMAAPRRRASAATPPAAPGSPHAAPRLQVKREGVAAEAAARWAEEEPDRRAPAEGRHRAGGSPRRHLVVADRGRRRRCPVTTATARAPRPPPSWTLRVFFLSLFLSYTEDGGKVSRLNPLKAQPSFPKLRLRQKRMSSAPCNRVCFTAFAPHKCNSNGNVSKTCTASLGYQDEPSSRHVLISSPADCELKVLRGPATLPSLAVRVGSISTWSCQGQCWGGWTRGLWTPKVASLEPLGCPKVASVLLRCSWPHRGSGLLVYLLLKSSSSRLWQLWCTNLCVLTVHHQSPPAASWAQSRLSIWLQGMPELCIWR